MKKENIKITDLNLWDENPRFPEEYFRKSDKELIEYLFNKKGEKEKIIELAKSIIENFGVEPWERLIVWKTENKKIVLEGNRRLMVYKILFNPNLIIDSKIKKIFKDGKNTTGIKNNYSIDCLITNDREIGLKYVELKHLEKGYKGWGEPERNNFKSRRGKKNDDIIIKIAIDERVKRLDIPQEIKEKILGHGFVTTFYRIVTTKPAKKHFGYEVKDDKLTIKDSNFDKKLKQIIWNVINKKTYSGLFDEQKTGYKDRLNSRTLNKNENIENYLKSIDNKSLKKAEKEIKESVKEERDLFGGKRVTVNTKQGQIKVNPKNSSRNTLIPNGRNGTKICSLKIDQDKINLIFRELRDDLFLDNVPNAIGVLFRVFLESTLDYFASKKGISFQKDIKLKGKVTRIADYLEKNNNVKKEKLKNIRRVATQNPSILSIQNFHDYVHDIKIIPKPADLIFKWDEIQEFFEIVYNEILNNKK